MVFKKKVGGAGRFPIPCARFGFLSVPLPFPSTNGIEAWGWYAVWCVVCVP
jgi:hypothetical protein